MRAQKKISAGLVAVMAAAFASAAFYSSSALAREIEYAGAEVTINVAPGEPTQINFPSEIKGGYKPKISNVDLDRKDSDLIVFAGEGLSEKGEAIIVRLTDGHSYSLRLRLADDANPRDDVVRIDDRRVGSEDGEEDLPPHKERRFTYAPANTVSGLMREMVLAAELGKKGIPGYRVSERYRGETVLSDGTMRATIDRIFIGPNLWGYVLDTHNMLDQTQQINPASFRLDGTRAISAERWELAPRPINVEQQISGKDKAKIYIVTRAKKGF
ncbi:MAG: hypothetical protein GX589_00635 [Deltaproteobacteria bacterium]|nr:hypothetical protein [Deltaproteobacteria bacterium]